MICPKCGSDVSSGNFCTKCGEKIMKDGNSSMENNGMSLNVVNNKKKGAKIIVLLVALLAGMCMLGLILFKVSYKPTINLNKYLSVNFEGYDSIGVASAEFDKTALIKDYQKKVKINKKEFKKDYADDFMSEDDLDNYIEKMNPVEEMLDRFITGELSNKNNLSNGDIINYDWDCDDEKILKYFNCKLKYEKEKEYTVETLKEISYIDPFEVLEVSFEGAEPNGTLNINVNSNDEKFMNLSYNADVSEGLSNDDSITIKVTINEDKEKYAEKFGVLPETYEKTYVVNGLDYYITSSNEITDDLMNQMQMQAKDVLESIISTEYRKSGSINNIEYLGNYFLVSKEESTIQNKCYLIFKVDISETFEGKINNHAGEDVTVEASYYTYVSYDNILMNADGNASTDLQNHKISENKINIETDKVQYDLMHKISYYELHHQGYESIDDLYNDAVSKNLNSYECENNVEEK